MSCAATLKSNQKTVEATVDCRRNWFLSTTISTNLKLRPTIDSIKKAWQRLYIIHQLRKFNQEHELLTQFPSAVMEAVRCTSITVRFSGGAKLAVMDGQDS